MRRTCRKFARVMRSFFVRKLAFLCSIESWGALDRREFLGQQNIHLLATLCASALLEKTGTSPPTVATRLAVWRAHLRRQLDSLSIDLIPSTIRRRESSTYLSWPGCTGEESPYGHPRPELLQRLEEGGMRIFRTDQEGTAQVRTDGHNLNVSCFVACPESATQSGRAQAPDNHENE